MTTWDGEIVAIPDPVSVPKVIVTGRFVSVSRVDDDWIGRDVDVDFSGELSVDDHAAITACPIGPCEDEI
jgi:hypothetical protein